jgi:pimeloyl-ACP methyl ester carboxylesterase
MSLIRFSHIAQTPAISTPASQPGSIASRFFRTLKLLLGVLAFCWMTGCAHPEPTLVVFVGGLGYSQLGDIRQAVIRECPDAKVVNAGGWDGYKSNLEEIINAKPHDHIILVGHSLGCPAISEAAAKTPRVDLTVFIDPAWDDFKVSKNVDQVLWYQRSDIDFPREAKIIGAKEPKVMKGSHNTIPHSPELIAEVVGAIKGIEKQTAKAKELPAVDKRALAEAHE